ncbi:hypothetical protein [Streptomyces anulatus]
MQDFLYDLLTDIAAAGLIGAAATVLRRLKIAWQVNRAQRREGTQPESND